MYSQKGKLIVLSGPSGCGKGTLIAELLKRGDCAVSISATTRPPRDGEQNHVHYHFLQKEEFEQCISEGALLEYASYCGNYYGTLRSEVESLQEAGKHVILEIEVQGALQIRSRSPEAILIFVIPPSLSELRRRLQKRGTESEEVMEERFARAREELPCAAQYDYVIMNDALEDAVADFDAILRAECLRPADLSERIGEMLL